MSSESIEERLTRLEEELSRARRRSRWLLACVSLAAVACAVAWLLTGSTSTPRTAEEAYKVVRANQFILEDDKGRTRASLSVNKDGPALGLSDENGKSRAGLSVGKHGPDLELYDENGVVRAGLGVHKDGPRLNLLDENGKAHAALGVLKDGPVLSLLDENGKTRAALGVDKDGPGLALLDQNGKPVWRAP